MQAELTRLEELKEQIARLTVEEKQLRTKLFGEMVPNPVEGTNTVPLANGYVIKWTFATNRSVDKAALPTVREMLEAKGVNADDLFRMKPELNVSAYKKASSDTIKILSLCVTEKPGLPSYEIVLPKR